MSISNVPMQIQKVTPSGLKRATISGRDETS